MGHYWWCLCCNKWLCWIFLVIVLFLSIFLFLIVEIFVIVACTVIMIWCALCHAVCWIGCFGNSACFKNCIKEPCKGPKVKGKLPDPQLPDGGLGTTPGTGTSGGPIPRPGPGTTVGPFTTSFAAFEVKTLAELDQLGAWRRVLLPWTSAPRVVIPGLSSHAKLELEATLERRLQACGCREGKIGLIAAAALLLVAGYLVPLSSGVTFGAVAFFLASLVAGAILGKASGVLAAHSQLRSAISRAKVTAAT